MVERLKARMTSWIILLAGLDQTTDRCQRERGVYSFQDVAYYLARANVMNSIDRDVLQFRLDSEIRDLALDEFQDTYSIQYAWVRVLAGEQDNLMVVGVDDQSIYGWGGARIENIQRFSEDFSNSTTIRLEQNYRSTGSILKAANHLIDNNSGRLGKQLWTDGGGGEPITLYSGSVSYTHLTMPTICSV